MTTGTGAPVGDKLNSLTIGARGPILLQDNVYLDEMSSFDRERIPERVVRAKVSGKCPGRDIALRPRAGPLESGARQGIR